MTAAVPTRAVVARPEKAPRTKLSPAMTRIIIGAGIAAVILIAGFVGPLLKPYGITTQDLSARLLAPSAKHWFGTDEFGRDVFTRTLASARIDIPLALAATVGPAIIGTILGALSGYVGSWLDSIIMRLCDVLQAFPTYIFFLVMVFVTGGGVSAYLVGAAVIFWVPFARLVRSEVMLIKELDYVRAARSLGFSRTRQLFRHIVPNAIPQVVVFSASADGVLPPGPRGPLVPRCRRRRADGRVGIDDRRRRALHPDGLVDLHASGPLHPRRRDRFLDPLRRPRPAEQTMTPKTATTVSAADLNNDPAPHREGPSAGLRLENLRVGIDRGHGIVDAVTGITFDLERGQTLGIVGESGSGKSLSLRAAMGALPRGATITGGEVHVDGHVMAGEQRRPNVAMIFQDPLGALNPTRRVGKQIMDAAMSHGGVSKKDAGSRAAQLMRDVGISDVERRMQMWPHELSGGLRQRIMIAMALATEPEVLLCDEPTTALDVTVQDQILGLLDQIRRERNVALVFVTHDLAVVANLCQRIAVMYAGEIVEIGPAEDVLNRPKHPYTRALLDASITAEVRPFRPIPGLPPDPTTFTPTCRFAARCQFATEACRETATNLGLGTHMSACIRETELEEVLSA